MFHAEQNFDLSLEFHLHGKCIRLTIQFAINNRETIAEPAARAELDCDKTFVFMSTANVREIFV